MKWHTYIILLLVGLVLLGCNKKKDTTQPDVLTPVETLEDTSIKSYVGSYSLFDKNWNLLEYTIYQQDSLFYANITYNQQSSISPLVLEDKTVPLYSFTYNEKTYFLTFDVKLPEKKTVRIVNQHEDRFLQFLEGRGFVDLPQAERAQQQVVKNSLNIKRFSSAMRPNKTNWSSDINYTDTVQYLFFDDISIPMRAVYRTKQNDTLRLSYDIPLGTEYNGSIMEIRWKIDTIVVKGKPMLNHKMLYYKVVR
ncbi:MAG: hypothetical protein KA397_04875 [Paludibacteraceae bacterium]|nr:hypothetical protein [Paludibacteraceae bacterium]MBP6284379.1 hypothetical protein [Paludibacteraceae bacterium]